MCETCAITLLPDVTLGDAIGPGSLAGLSDLIQLSDGRYIVTDSYDDAVVFVFGGDGAFQRRLGRRGNGPGEFRFARLARATRSELHIIDPLARRDTVFALSDFRVLRTRPFGGRLIGDVEVLDGPGQLVVMNIIIASRAEVGRVLHVFDEDGNPVQSMDEPSEGYRFDVPDPIYWRNLSPASTGGVWSAHMVRYQIDLWATDGTLERSFERNLDWFPSHDGQEGAPDPQDPPRPRLLDVHEDEEGRLWTLTRVASTAWAESLSPVSRTAHPEEGAFAIADLDRAFDSIIEVIDPDRSAVLASSRLDVALVQFLNGEKVVSVEEGDEADAASGFRVRVWRMVFEAQ